MQSVPITIRVVSMIRFKFFHCLAVHVLDQVCQRLAYLVFSLYYYAVFSLGHGIARMLQKNLFSLFQQAQLQDLSRTYTSFLKSGTLSGSGSTITKFQP